MRLGRGIRRRRDDDGAAAVEFALLFCFILVPLVMGLLQYGWYFYTGQVTGSAVRETARRLAVGDCYGSNAAENFARQQSGLSTLELQYGPPGGETDAGVPPTASGDVLRVRATSSGSIGVTFFPIPNSGLHNRHVDVRVEDLSGNPTCS
jgi:hypothetical protein